MAKAPPRLSMTSVLVFLLLLLLLLVTTTLTTSTLAKPPARRKRTRAPTTRPLPFVDLPIAASSGGRLDVTLVASLASGLTIAGRYPATATVWNGSFVAPGLSVKRGDRVRLTVRNDLTVVTNVHYHGLRISPKDPADNSFRLIAPGTSYTYDFVVPKDHPRGLYWIHSHAMGLTEAQIFNGMSTVLVIEGALDPFPSLAEVKTRLMAIRDVQVPLPVGIIDSNAPTARLVNGLLRPTLTMAPGETQVFSLANIGADLFYDVALLVDGDVGKPLNMSVLAVDGETRVKPVQVQHFILVPGSRADVLVTAPLKQNTRVTLETLDMNTAAEYSPDITDWSTVDGGRGFFKAVYYAARAALPKNRKTRAPTATPTPQGMDVYPRTVLAEVLVQGEPVPSARYPTTKEYPQVRDLRKVRVAAHRDLVYSADFEKRRFFVNGKSFSPDRVDIIAKLGTVERWTIRNHGMTMHTFHMHQGAFQVVSVGGKAVDFNGMMDSVVIPIRRQLSNGTFLDVPVDVLIPFLDARVAGKTQAHCHISLHTAMGVTLQIGASPPPGPSKRPTRRG